MPRRIDVYPDNPEWIWLNLTSSIFSFVLTIGFAMFVLDLILQATLGKRESRDPWQAPTLDWAMPLPEPSYNFASLPTARHLGKDAGQVILRLARGEGVLPGAPRGQREFLVTSVGDAEPDHVAILPGNTALPLALSASIGVFVLLMLASLYALAGVALLPVAVLIWVWARGMAPTGNLEPLTVAPGLQLPVHHRAGTSLGQSGLVAFLVANGTLFASLLFGLAFLSVVTPGPEASTSGFVPRTTGIALAVLSLAVGLAAICVTAFSTYRAAVLALLLNICALIALAWLAATQMDDPTRHARDALRAVMAGYAGLHLLVAAGMAAFVIDQFRRNEISTDLPGAWPALRMWQHYTTITILVTIGVLMAHAVLA